MANGVSCMEGYAICFYHRPITVSSQGAKPRGDLLVQCADPNLVPGDCRALRLAMTVVGGSWSFYLMLWDITQESTLQKREK